VPLVPLVPALSALVSFVLMMGLPWDTWQRLIVWMAIGLALYAGYGYRKSRLRTA
jgi:APA family basic amino acid/polyamine antiporter